MTTNAFIFSWDCNGIEAIIPISKYERWDAENTFKILLERPTRQNPLNSIIGHLILRARHNSQRHYEIYAIDCSTEMDEQFWRDQWEAEPQHTANLIRERGYKIYSDRVTTKPVIV